MTSITILDVTSDQLIGIGQVLGGTASSTGTGTGTSTGTPPPPVTNFFPASPADAPAPSPEGSKIVSLNGVVSGKPYLVDKNGGIWQMGSVGTTGATGFATSVPANVILFNGKPLGIQGDSMQIVQGEMYWHYLGFYWKYVLPGIYGYKNTNLPAYVPAFGQQYVPPSASSPGSLPGMPALPPLVSPAPGSTAAIVQATGTLAAALASASAGGTVALTPGITYKESVGITIPLKLTGGGTVANPGTATALFSGGAKIDATGVALFQGKGAVVPMTDVILDGIEITGAGLNEPASGGGTGGIRNGAASNMVVRNCYLHDNQDGIGPNVTSTLLLENCIIENCGLGGGQTHNIYTQAITATFNNVTSIMPPQSASPLRTVTGLMNGGHALKSRANMTTINGGYYYSGDASCLDIPDGSTQPCVITGATIEKKAGDGNHTVLGYAVESMTNGVAGVKFVDCHFILNCASPQFITVNGGSLSFTNCTWEGTKPTAVGFSSVTGLPV